jgi:decaprenylphospho-beta-D-erythro-pentofuranosid-2-ulose 2-reductase
MKNGVGQFQTVLLVGSTSEIGNAIIASLSLASNARVIRIGVDETSDFRLDFSAPVGTDSLDFLNNLPDVDVAIFASGILGHTPNLDNQVEMSRLAMINFSSLILVINRIASKLVSQGHGKIVILSSVAGLRPRTENYVYGATKSGLDFYGRGLGEHLRNSGVAVLIVRPGFIHTKMTENREPAPFAASPESVGSAVSKALERNRSLIYVPGILRYIFLLLRLLPQFLFRRLTAK